MSKVLKTVAKVAGVVAAIALIGTGIGAALGGTMILVGVGTAASIASIAGAISGIAGTLAQVTAKPPRAVGQATSITIGANQPIPYMIGRGYSGGAMVHDIGYGGVVSDVDNPYRAITIVYSGAGPIQALVATQADFAGVGFFGTAATGYYAGFLWRDWLDGTGPAPRALAAQFSGEPGWSGTHKLSGFFGVKYTLKFDKKGKVWQAGAPQFGVIADGVRAYDPRLDSTFPGGLGSQRINNEATWTFTKNPALHALTYSYGRYQNGKKIFGVDLGASGIDLTSAVAWANVCDANGWEVNGTIYEPGDKWNNLKLICEAGGGVPVPGARLRFDYNAAGVSVDTISIHDLGDGEISLPVTQGYASRINTVQGVYTSPNHRWEPVPTDKIVDTVSLATDGEEKAEQFPFQLVTAKNQAAQLATYKMANSREKGPIVIPVKARILTYPVGTFLTAQLAAIGFASQKVKIIGKRRTMEDGSGEITVLTETDAKHAFALAATSGAPPESELVPPERLDELAFNTLQAAANFVQSTTPSPTESVPGNIWLNTSTGIYYRRVNNGGILLGGFVVTLGGNIPVIYWTEISGQPLLNALTAAAAAQATANSALATANAAADRLLVIDDDGILDKAEKVAIFIPNDTALEDAYQSILSDATDLELSTAALTAARTAYLSFRNAISPAWNDTTTDSPIARGTLDAVVDAFRSQINALGSAINLLLADNVPYYQDIPDIVVEASYTGAVNAGELPITIAPQRYLANINVTELASWSVTPVGGVTLSAIDNSPISPMRGQFSITAVSAINSTFVISSIHKGLTIEKTVKVTRKDAIAPAPAGGGGGGGAPGSPATDNTFAVIGASGADIVISDVLDVVVGSSGQVDLTAPLAFNATQNNSLDDADESNITLTWEYSANGTSGWSAVGASQVSSDGAYKYFSTVTPRGLFTQAGSITIPRSKTGLTSGAHAFFRLLGRRTSGLYEIASISGTATARPI